MRIHWINESQFLIGDTKFQSVSELGQFFSFQSENGYVVGKNREILEKYAELFSNIKVERIVELGVFRGGSSIFLNEYFKPEKLVVIDINKDCNDLDDYIKKEALNETVRPYYQVDQADINKLQKIYQNEFLENSLDLVIDDASHLLDNTRKSFNFFFPKLKIGAWYIIEDWDWSLANNPHLNRNFKGQKPLVSLVYEIIEMLGQRVDIAEEIILNKRCCMIKKGKTEIDQDTFKVESFVQKKKMFSLF